MNKREVYDKALPASQDHMRKDLAIKWCIFAFQTKAMRMTTDQLKQDVDDILTGKAWYCEMRQKLIYSDSHKGE